MARVIGTVARWTAWPGTDKTIAAPGRLGPIASVFLQRIAVLIPTPQMVEGSLVAAWSDAVWKRVVRAVEELQRTESGPGVRVQ